MDYLTPTEAKLGPKAFTGIPEGGDGGIKPFNSLDI